MAFAKEANPELAKADDEVLGLSVLENALFEADSALPVDDMSATGSAAKSTCGKMVSGCEAIEWNKNSSYLCYYRLSLAL